MSLVMVVVGAVIPAGAGADPFAVLGSFGTPNGSQGGQLSAQTRGLDVNRSGVGAPAGSVYVAEANPNHRVSQFDADGDFVRTWGFDVVDGVNNPGAANDNGTGFEVCDVTAGNVASECKQGVAGPAAGQLANPSGLAVDQSNGFVYVTSINNRRVDVFSPTGEFAGAFGWGVDTGANALEVCTTASTCQIAGAAGGDAGRFGASFTRAGIAVDPDTAGRLLVPDLGNLRMSEYQASLAGGVLTGVSFVRSFGRDVVSAGPGNRTFDQAERQQVGLVGAIDHGCFCILPVNGGTFTLSFDPDGGGPSPVETTGAIAFNASAATVQQRLEDDLASVAPGDVSVASTTAAGMDPVWTVDFTGAYLGSDVAQLTGNATALTPAGSSVMVSTVTQGGEFPDFEVCVPGDGDTCKAGIAGNQTGSFTSGSPGPVAIAANGDIYAVSGPSIGACSANTPCRIQRFDSDGSSPEVFGSSSGPGQLVFESGNVPAVAAANVAIDPDSGNVLVQRRVSTTEYRVLEFDTDANLVETHPAGAPLATTSTTNNLQTGLAFGPGGDVYTSLGAQVFILGEVDPPEVTADAVTEITATSARFNGTVEIPAPGAPTFATTHRFEYSANGVDWTAVPAQPVAVGDGSDGTHLVSRTATGLQPSTLYQVRLVATTGPTATSVPVVFTTDGSAPTVALSFVDEVTQTEARLGAHIDPEGSPTKYRFEWGTQPCSSSPGACTQVPGFERGIGAGNQQVIVNEPITGLDEETTYHYRVIATNGEDTTTGPDQTFETLNDCNLTRDRCYELVSPADKGPDGSAGDHVALGEQQAFQVAADGSAVSYRLAYGLPDATSGNEVSYVSRRDGAGWSTGQSSPPAVWVDGGPANNGEPARLWAMSSDLSCGVFSSVQPVGDDPPLAALQAGYGVLYVTDLAGSWTAVTETVPTSAAGDTPPLPALTPVVGVASLSGDGGQCDRVVFRSKYQYGDDVEGAGAEWLYSWDGGSLEYVGIVPGPGGPQVVQAIPGASFTRANDSLGATQQKAISYTNVVSEDGSRVFFTAVSQLGNNAGEQSVFRRELGSSVAVDAGQSQTVGLPGGTTNTDDSLYWTASKDGSDVFFTGRYGLASDEDGTAVHSSSGPSACDDTDGTGCDLYRYSYDTGKLTDLSADVHPDSTNANGASVIGVLGSSDDGEYVYFAARGQLVPDEGRSEAANVAGDTYSVYLAHDGDIHYVGTADETDTRDSGGGHLSTLLLWGMDGQNLGNGNVTSRVTPDGRHLLYQTAQDVTGYDSGGLAEAYLYDYDKHTTVCVSCRRDGQPSTTPPSTARVDVPLQTNRGGGPRTPLHPAATLSADGSQVVFQSFSRLAPGAVEGEPAMYVWRDGQVTFVATSRPGTTTYGLTFVGASSDGDDVFFTSVDRLTWQDVDSKRDIYVARPGGGIDELTGGLDPCDPLADGGCGGDGVARVDTRVDTSAPAAGQPRPAGRAVLGLGGLSRAKLVRLGRGGRVGLAVRVSRPGWVTVRGVASVGGFRTEAIAARRRATRAGVVRIAVRLTRPARRRLARSGWLRVRLVVRMQDAQRPAVRTLRFRKATRTNRRHVKRAASRSPARERGVVAGVGNEDRETGR